MSSMTNFDHSLVRLAVALHLVAAIHSIHPLISLLDETLPLPLDVVLVVLRLDELVGAQCALVDLQRIETVRDLEEMVRGWQDTARHNDVGPSTERSPGQCHREASRTESGILPIAQPYQKIRAVG